jgi:hypothetical protein
MRWHYRDPLLLWLFVPAYLAHLAEEWWAGPGFPAWIAAFAGRPLPGAAFIAINATALVLLVAGIRAATRRESAGWIAVAIATVVSLNAVLHLLGSLAAGSYSPGMVTGIVIYVPLGLLTLLRASHQQSPPAFARGALAGIVIHAVVILAALAATA